MLGHEAVPGAQRFGDLADGGLFPGDEAQDAQPHRAGEGFQEHAGLVRGGGKTVAIDLHGRSVSYVRIYVNS